MGTFNRCTFWCSGVQFCQSSTLVLSPCDVVVNECIFFGIFLVRELLGEVLFDVPAFEVARLWVIVGIVVGFLSYIVGCFADRQNQLNQAVIGAKEGCTKGIVAKVQGGLGIEFNSKAHGGDRRALAFQQNDSLFLL